jgi:hypothetical protein
MRMYFQSSTLTTLLLFVPVAVVQAAAPVHVYQRVEIPLTAASKPANPYTDVEVWVDLKGPHFNKRCHGFWDGGQTWRVRITSTEPGTWTWVSGSNPSDAGLAGKRGSFVSIPWTEAEKRQNPNRRGFPRPTPNGHALQYADGTPYFIIGDFFYPASTVRYKWRDSDEAYAVDTPEAGFKDMLKFRKTQEFNMIYIISCFPSWAYDGHPARFKDNAGVPLRDAWPSGNEDRAEDMPNEAGERPFFFPGKAAGYPDVGADYFRINPSYFRYLDKKMDYAYSQGFQVFIETLRRDIGPYLKAYYGATDTDMSKNAVFHYIRYIFARYQADPVFFGIIHQDIGGVYALTPQEWLPCIEGYYKKYGHPPFGQFVTTNPDGSTYKLWGHTDKAPWLTMHQVGNNPRDHTSSELMLEMYSLPKPIPAYNQEPWYVANDTPEEGRRNRGTMYSNLLNGGMAGVAYEAMGLTRGNRENSDRFANMWVSIKWQSANQLRFARDFLMADGTNYQDLVPHRELLSVFKTGNDPAWVGSGAARIAPQEKWAYCMRTDDKKHFKMYFERSASRPDLSGALPKSVYKARWFDPRAGAWSSAGEGTLTSDTQGKIVLPACPTSADDWGLSLSTN